MLISKTLPERTGKPFSLDASRWPVTFSDLFIQMSVLLLEEGTCEEY